MNVLRHTDADFERQLRRVTAPPAMFDPVIEERVRAVIAAVARSGDESLLEFTERFDAVRLTAERLPVGAAERLAASVKADPALRTAMGDAAKNITAFARRSLRKDWSVKNSHGATVGERFDPFQRVGVYVPGGTAPLASTALMTVLLAKAAGCPEIVVCTPPGPGGAIHPALLFAINLAGATRVFRLGGAQAIAAMALGTTTVPRVQKIFGPGNDYVVAAKRLLFGRVSVDLLPGPSEVLVLADDAANPRFAAADLLAQAEHGSGHERVWLVTPSAALLQRVRREIERQLPKLNRRAFIEKALSANGWLIQVKHLDQAVELTNRIAPEHCEIMTGQPRRIASRVRTAREIFLGPWSPTVLGDYVAGPSHTLPTGGAGASFAGLTVDQFQRRTSVVEYGRAALRKALPAVRQFSEIEGLDAHGRSATVRF